VIRPDIAGVPESTVRFPDAKEDKNPADEGKARIDKKSLFFAVPYNKLYISFRVIYTKLYRFIRK